MSSLTPIHTGLDSTPTVHQAWNAVMNDVREIRKGERADKFNFRGIDSVMNAVGPALREHGVSVVPVDIDPKHRDFTDAKGRVVHEAIITVTYVVTGPAGDSFRGASIGESSDYSDKATTQAMSVAYRTFLLQSLTMPTDEPDPDLTTVDRNADDWAGQGWTSAEARDTQWKVAIDRIRGKADGPEKDALRAWVKVEGLTRATLTFAQATELAERVATLPDPETAPDQSGDGWKSDRERAETFASLLARQNDLALDSAADLTKWGKARKLDEATLTREQATEWLERIIQAELGAADVTGDDEGGAP